MWLLLRQASMTQEPCSRHQAFQPPVADLFTSPRNFVPGVKLAKSPTSNKEQSLPQLRPAYASWKSPVPGSQPVQKYGSPHYLRSFYILGNLDIETRPLSASTTDLK